MYIVGQTGRVIVNSERMDVLFTDQQDGMLAIKARNREIIITLGLYKTERSLAQAMADLGLALIAGDSNQMKVYAMRSDDPETEQKTEEETADGPES